MIGGDDVHTARLVEKLEPARCELVWISDLLCGSKRPRTWVEPEGNRDDDIEACEVTHQLCPKGDEEGTYTRG